MQDLFKKIFYSTSFFFVLIFYLTYSILFKLFLEKIGYNLDNFNIFIKSILLISVSLLFLLILCFIYRKDLKEEFKIFKKNYKSIIPFSIKWWAIGLVLMGLSNVILNFVFHVSPDNEENVQTLISQMTVYAIVLACFFAPFMEELIFRKSLKKCFSSDALFILFSGLIFGLIHVITSSKLTELLYIVPYGLFGCIFGYIYCKTKTIFSTITIHMIHNTILVLISLISLGVF